MSLGKQKNLIILGAVAMALLAGGVLVADYADVLPGRAKTCEQVKSCGAGEAKPCCAAKAEDAGVSEVVAATEAAGFPQVMAASEAAPAESTCGAGKLAGGCGEAAAGCEKPMGGCEKPMGCCEEDKPAEAAGGCCAAKADAATE